MSRHKPAPPPAFAPGAGFSAKPGLDTKGDLEKPRAAARQHRRSLASPCDRPPAVPTGVQMRFRAVEAGNHLRFKGRIVWNDVTQDSSGFPITTVDRFDVQWRAVDADGDPVEVEHAALTDATNPSGTTYRFTTTRNHGWTVGDVVKITGCYPQTNYNGTWTITAIGAANRFDVSGGTPGESDAKRPGEVYNQSTDQQFRRKLRNPVQRSALRSATHTTGPNKHHFTTRGDNGFNVGQKITVAGCKPQTGYNGNWVIDTITDADTFTVLGGSGALADAETLGKVTDRDDFLHVVMPTIPRPKSWRWQARVRARSGEGCWSAFSAWTTAVLPWDGADPKPPVPTYGATPITFDRKGKDKQHKIRLLFTYDEVGNWDVPGGDREDDVKSYVVQIDQSTDGVNWDTARGGGTPYRTQSRPAKDTDADTTRVSVFPRIAPHFWYRARVRTVDRFNRRGDFSAWTGPALPFDDADPPTPLNVEIFPRGTDRVVVAWDDPTVDLPTSGTVSGTSGTAGLTGTGTHFLHQIQPGSIVKVGGNTYTVKTVTSATALTLTSNLSTSPSGAQLYEVAEDPDAAAYQVQITKSTDVDTSPAPNVWQAVYARDRVIGNRKAFKVQDADVALTFHARVRTVDAARNRSAWVPAWNRAAHSGAANSDPDVDSDGVVIVPGLSFVVAEFEAPRGEPVGSQINTGVITKRWENLTTNRLYFTYARMTCGDRDAATGSPGGASIIVQFRRYLDDGTTYASLFAAGNRLVIAIGDYRSGKETNFDIPYLDPGEALQLNVQQVGSGAHGQDLNAQIYMDVVPPVA